MKQNAPTSVRYDGISYTQPLPVDRKRKRQEPISPTSSKLVLLAESSSDISSHDSLAEFVKQDWFIEQQNQLREIRRVRQIRYRKKQQDYMETMEENNRHLQQEIDKLEERRRAVAAAVPSKKTLWYVAVEYFRLFRYGLRASDLSDRSRRLLASKLLDQSIAIHGSTRFDWDIGYGRVTSVISESDMLTPMLQVLGRLDG
ncbi:uncharacterized protein PITG_16884 [Phytophthora infestans T30-4]|uniref:BZIP domain-containing protein n=1 Tax=Phytophthora infestans (strain T30-4) TaxID=403677 RepID=D0NUB7_PHYIT|nr:uncharacterized protein PITG_16884 [Phytophthora infestans T30-4]EEY65250.1 conserved hypothetical protein [Phytophthora infestans T30-4]|eukprot:XP_002897314.1 conserved hypothetical protein [Phytophthora infestans T30-4]